MLHGKHGKRKRKKNSKTETRKSDFLFLDFDLKRKYDAFPRLHKNFNDGCSNFRQNAITEHSFNEIYLTPSHVAYPCYMSQIKRRIV